MGSDHFILAFRYVDKSPGGGVNDVEKADDGGPIVRDGHLLADLDELVHPARAESGLDDVDDRRACADVAEQLSFSWE